MGFSLLAHLVLGVLFVTLLSERITQHWRWEGIKRAFVGNVDKSPVYVMDFDGYQSLPKNQWLKIHQQTPTDAVHFFKEPSSGSAFDHHRAHLLVFGGNTTQNAFSNTIYTFNMNKLQWHESYSSDSMTTYSVDEKGFPVAGFNHPWAINTYGGIEYDSLFDSLVIASSPQQLAPSRAAGKNLTPIWSSIKQHPTWNYSFIGKEWTASENNGADFYAYTMSYDSDRDVMTGFAGNSVFNWTRNAGWKKVAQSNINQWSINSVYDSANHAFVIYGGNAGKNDVYSYVSGEASTKKMPTIGERPPAGSAIPLAFHGRMKKTVAVINAGEIAQTWLYDLEKDRWERLPADFPFNVGMNYAMEYDAVHNLIVFIANPTHEETAVWVLKI